MGDTLKNAINILYTKIVWRGARLVRMSIVVRNRINFCYGKGFTCGTGCRINPGPKGKLCIGNNFVMGDQCQIEAMKEQLLEMMFLLHQRSILGMRLMGIIEVIDKQVQSNHHTLE